MSHPPVFDPVFDADNPEWTSEDFGRAKSLDAFPELQAALKVKPTAKRGNQSALRKTG